MTTVWKKRLLALILLSLVAALGAALWQSGLLERLSNKDRLIESWRASGVKGPLLCIVVQFVQVVVFIIPGEITQFASGYVFGTWLGFLYSIFGIMLGSAFNFYFARLVGRPVLEKFIHRATLEKIDAALNNAEGKSAIFVLFLIPGTPKDAMSYGAGFTNMSLAEFAVITGLARSPALLFSILLGSQAYRRDYGAMIITAVVAGLAIAGYYLYERRRNRQRRAEQRP